MAAMAYALRCRQNGEAQEAAWASRRAYEALDHFVLNREVGEGEESWEGRALSHPLVQAELVRQQSDLNDLQAATPSNMASTILNIESRAKSDSIIFFGSPAS